MPRQKQQPSSFVYQLKVTLKDCKPPIWRRVLVRSDTSLGKLHDIIQIAMGWDDDHLHEFTVHGVDYGARDPDLDLDVKDERRMRLSQALSAVKGKITYLYDFGDSWEHDIVLEKILPVEEGAHYPNCIAGKRTCPPEDCGGIWGYANLLEAMQDPNHPDHEDMMEWMGGPFDPEAFDMDEVNQALSRIR